MVGHFLFDFTSTGLGGKQLDPTLIKKWDDGGQPEELPCGGKKIYPISTPNSNHRRLIFTLHLKKIPWMLKVRHAFLTTTLYIFFPLPDYHPFGPQLYYGS